MKSFMKSLKEGASKSSSKHAGKLAAAGKKTASKGDDQQPVTEKREAGSSAAPVAAHAAAHDPITASAVTVVADDGAAPDSSSAAHPHHDLQPQPAASVQQEDGTAAATARDCDYDNTCGKDEDAVALETGPASSSSDNSKDGKSSQSAARDPIPAVASTTDAGSSEQSNTDVVSTSTASGATNDQQPVHVLHDQKEEEAAAAAVSSSQSNTSNINQSSTKSEGSGINNMPAPDAVSSYSKDLERHGLQSAISRRLCQLFSSGKLSLRDLDDRAIDALKEYGNMDAVLTILDEFEGSNLEHVNNKSAFLCGLMKTHRQKEKALKHKGLSIDSNSSGKDHSSAISANGYLNMTSAGPVIGSSDAGVGGGGDAVAPAAAPTGVAPGPDEAALKAILQRTGYTLDVTSGQRKYGGPPPDWTDPPPGPGCEIFVGKIPKELFEEELIPVFEEVGKIWDLRLMIDPVNGFNRGFAFITYCTKEEATSAQIRFDGYEIRKGKPLKVNVSVPNLRLFVGNIPKSKSKSEIFNEFNKLTGGLNEVIVYSSPDDRKKNRGFCFLEYDSHKSASLAKRKLSTSRTGKVWGCDILVDWADPQEEPDQATMERVKVLYVRNLVADVTEDELKEVFAAHGLIERVKKIKDYAFIHFEDRDAAVRAMRNLQESELRGVKISVSLAKPPSDRKKKEEILRNRERRVTLMMQQRSLVPGMPGPNLPPLTLQAHHHLPAMAMPNGSLRSAKGARGQSFHMGVPPASPYRSVPPYHPASAWAQLPEWLPYAAGYPANWNWAAYSPADPRSAGALAAAAAAGPAAQYARSMPTHHPGGMSVASLNANSRNHRSLWTPNGPASSSMNGPTQSAESKSKSWRRNRNGDSTNSGSGHKSGFGDGRV